MNKIATQIIQKWNVKRVLGLIIGLFLAIQAVIYKDAILGILSVFFLFQIVTNTGCFSANECSIPVADNMNEEIK